MEDGRFSIEHLAFPFVSFVFFMFFVVQNK
jgi:hypothetical protein